VPMETVSAPEKDHVILHNIRWETFLALLEDLGEHRGRITYDRGTVEIVSPSKKHESLKKLIGRLIETFTLELGIPIASCASTTLKSRSKNQGIEPDECYYIRNEESIRGKDAIDLEIDPPPDLAVEIEIAARWIDRKGVYAALGIPEVWSYDGQTMIIYLLQEDGEYSISKESAALPMLPVSEIVRFLDQRSSRDETSLVSAFRDWVQERFGTV
jgi:Uma2 family endonuclease